MYVDVFMFMFMLRLVLKTETGVEELNRAMAETYEIKPRSRVKVIIQAILAVIGLPMVYHTRVIVLPYLGHYEQGQGYVIR